MKKLLLIIPPLFFLVLAGCASNSIDAVNKACGDGKIEKFRERKDNDELMFSCFEADTPEDVIL